MKTLSLQETHTHLGARFTPISDWQAALHYGDARQEHQAVRTVAGLFDLSFRGCVYVTGEDRAKFLQGLLTNDVMQLVEGRGQYAAILNPKGRMLCDLRLYAREDFYIMDVDPEITDKTVQILSRYLMRIKAKLENVTERVTHLAIHGPASTAILKKALGMPIPEGPDFSNTALEQNGHRIYVIRSHYTGEVGYDLIAPRERGSYLWNRLMESGEAQGLKPAGVQALETLRIEAGVPRYGPDMDENTFPPEAGLEEKAISYTKGCYVGQETIARIKTYGQVHRKLIGFVLEDEASGEAGLPQYQDKVFKGGEDIGSVTSAAYSPTLGRNIAMGYIRRKLFEPGLEVTVEVSRTGQRLNARLVELPFVPAKIP